MDFLARYIPKALGPILYTKTCLYTLTPDRDFVIDRLPAYPDVVVGVGGGHGFKFASLVGQILAELAIDGRTDRNIEPFRIDRAILQLANPPVNYMV
jgi:sarcosine oxidase